MWLVSTMVRRLARQTSATGKSLGQMTVHWPQRLQPLIIRLALRVPWTMVSLLKILRTRVFGYSLYSRR